MEERRMKKRLVLLTVLALILSSIGPLTALAQGGQSLLVWADETRAPVILALGEQFAAEYNVTIEVTEMGAPDARDQIQVAWACWSPTGCCLPST
jgi:ABC-type glycerol-3-phosphate transport system substrate-binding protein